MVLEMPTSWVSTWIKSSAYAPCCDQCIDELPVLMRHARTLLVTAVSVQAIFDLNDAELAERGGMLLCLRLLGEIIVFGRHKKPNFWVPTPVSGRRRCRPAVFTRARAGRSPAGTWLELLLGMLALI